MKIDTVGHIFSSVFDFMGLALLDELKKLFKAKLNFIL